MRSFACFSVILLARFALSENLPSCAPAQVKYCVLDDCLGALSNRVTSNPQFCGEYLEDDSISIPNYVPTAASASRISSACSCLIQAQPTPKPTALIPSSYTLGFSSSSISTAGVSSHETSDISPLSSPIASTFPVSTAVVPGTVNKYITSTIYAISTYTTHASGQLITKTLSVFDSTTVYPVTQEVTETPSQKSTAPVEYTTSTIYTLSTYTNIGGDVVTKTIVDYTTVCPVTEKSTPTSQALGESASAYTTQYETSTIYRVSKFTTLGQTITKTVVDYTTVCPVTKASSAPEPSIEYTTSTVYSLSTSTYTASGKVVTVTNIVVDYTTVCPVTNLPSLTETVPALSTSLSVSSTKTKARHSRTKCTKGPHYTQSYPFGNYTSLHLPTASGSVVVSSTSENAYPSSVRYPMSNSTLSQTSTGTGYSASSTAYAMTNSTTLHATSGTEYPSSSTTHSLSNSTFSYVPSGTGYSIPANTTTSVIPPASTLTSEKVSSSSQLPESTETSIKSAPSTTSSSALPSITAFCSTDAAALLFATAGAQVTSYCSSLLSIQSTFVDGGYEIITQTAYTTTTTTIAPPSVTVFKRGTESDPYSFTSAYDLAQQSSACSCLSIQPAEISETITITVPATSTVFVSTTACTPIATQVVVNGDFEIATSGSYQAPWTVGSGAYVQSSVNNAFPAYSGSEFAVLYGRSRSSSSISQLISTLVPGQSYTLTYYVRVMGTFTVPGRDCTMSASVGGVTVDTLVVGYSNIVTYRNAYIQRTVTVAAISQTAALQFAWQCGVTSSSADLLLDTIAMVGAGDTCGVAP